MERFINNYRLRRLQLYWQNFNIHKRTVVQTDADQIKIRPHSTACTASQLRRQAILNILVVIVKKGCILLCPEMFDNMIFEISSKVRPYLSYCAGRILKTTWIRIIFFERQVVSP